MQKSIQFVRYMITGGMTTLLDIFLLYIAVDKLEMGILPGTGFAFIGALMFSFFMNSSWTFAKDSSGNIWKAHKIIKFILVSLIGLSLSLFCMWILAEQQEIFYLLAKIITSFVVLFWNFLANSLWTFSETEETENFLCIEPLLPEEKIFPYEVSIVIPAYNEAKRISKTLKQAKKFFTDQKTEFEIIVVDDGSTDTTVQVAQKHLALPHRIISLKKNSGKGAAIAYGMQEAQGRYLLFCDADGATPFREYNGLRKMMMTYHIAIGSRYTNKTKVKSSQPVYRIFFSRLINFFAQVFLIDGFSDTQCGFKLFRSQSGKKIFSQQKIHRYAFDIECLVLAKKLHYHVAEVPVEWHDQEGSKFSGLQDGLKTAYDFVRIKFFMMFRMYKG